MYENVKEVNLMSMQKRRLSRPRTAKLTVEDYVSESSLVRVIDQYVNSLNLAALGFKHSVVHKQGNPPYTPDDLLKLYLYGYWNRIRTSHRLEAECQRNLEVMWLLGNLAFDHQTIADFRRDNAQPFKTVCAQFVQFVRDTQLVVEATQLVAVDASKLNICTPTNSVVTPGSMAKRRAYIESRVAKYLQQLDETDRTYDEEGRPTPECVKAALERLRERNAISQQAKDYTQGQKRG